MGVAAVACSPTTPTRTYEETTVADARSNAASKNDKCDNCEKAAVIKTPAAAPVATQAFCEDHVPDSPLYTDLLPKADRPEPETPAVP